MTRYPALWYAIAAVIGVSAVLYHWALLFLLLLFPFRLHLTFIIAIIAALTTSARIDLPQETLEGQGQFSISKVSHSRTGWQYQGTLRSFTMGKNIPTFITLPDRFNTPKANQDYIVSGTLRPGRSTYYTLKPNTEKPWIPVSNTFSLAEKRYKAKRWLCKTIRENLTHSDSIAFLTGIATGDFDDPMLQHDFSRFGLQHIMAISGFHFSLIAAFLTFLLRLVLSQRATTITIMILLTSYFVFLGPGPSVLRAFTTILIALTGTLLNRSTSGINALAFATLFLIAYDPLLITTIGFPFSALTTASILLFYPWFYFQFKKVFTHRYLSEVSRLHPLEQHGYCILHFLCQSAALTVAVNIIAIPLTLFYFGQFPLLSIIYNLFFPFLVSISMILLLAALALPPLAPLLFKLNDFFTHTAIAYTSNLPIHLDYTITSIPMNTPILITILIALLYFSLNLKPLSGNLFNFHGDRSSVG